MKLFSLSLQQCLVRWSMVLIVVMTNTVLTSQPAQASAPVENHCILPNGVDLNVLFGISEQIVGRFCSQVDSGEHWTASGAPWGMNTSFEAVPEGFVPAGATPLEDFLAKFVGVKYVIDRGTLQERTYVFPTSDKLWIGTVAGLPAVNGVTLSLLNPLSVGDHFVELYWVFSAMHCDGLGAVIEENCIPAGETLYARTAFVVTPGAVQSQ